MDNRGKEEELRVPKFIDNGNGCEVITNDGEIKIILRRVISFTAEIEEMYYITDYYVKDGNGWVKTNESHTYKQREEFFDNIERSEDFTQAYNDYLSATTEQTETV